MTVTPSQGFPDWQSYSQWGENILNQQAFAAPKSGNVICFNGGLGNFNAVQLVVTPSGGTGTVSFIVYPPGQPSTSGRLWSWTLTNGGPTLSVLLPTWGQSVYVALFETTGTGAFDAYVSITAVNESVSKPTYQANQNYVSERVNLPASGGSAGINLPYIASGRLNINISHPAAASISDVELNFLQPNGVWGQLVLLDAPLAAAKLYDLALPGDSVQLYLFNSGTAAINGIYVGMWTDSD